MIGQTRSFVAAFLAACGFSSGASRQDSVPRIDSISPPAAQRGTSLEATVAGENLSGIVGVSVVGESGVGAALIGDTESDGKSARVRLTASADAAPGEREVRLLCRSGVSNPFMFIVTLLPVIEEKGANKARTAAQKVSLPAAIMGRLAQAGEIHYFGFPGNKGDRYVFNVFASRVGSNLDPALTLYDEAGKEIASNDDALELDSFLEVTLPAKGAYVVAVRDSQYKGGDGFSYRLDAGAFPHVESLFPLGGRRGAAVDVALAGRNLGTLSSMRVDLAPDAPLGAREVRAETAAGPSNARLFEVGDLPECTEQEPNDAFDKANVVALPITINGRMNAAGDADFFRFNAGEHAHLQFEVVSRRLGSFMDPLVILRGSDGVVMAQNDDTAGMDARLEQKDLVKGKDYVVCVRDLTDRAGENFAYRLTIRPAGTSEADFSVKFMPDAIRVSRGGRAKMWCETIRVGDYKGDVTACFKNLPPGVTCEPVILSGAAPSSGLFVVSASADAPLGSFPVELTAMGKIGDCEAVRAGKPALKGRVVRQAFLTVLDTALFTIETLGAASEEEAGRKKSEIQEAEKILATQTPALDIAQAEWERFLETEPSWTVLVPETAHSAQGATLTRLEDNSILAGGKSPAFDTYTVTARAPFKGIRAVRLETLTDKSLPQSGPGRADGNFFLTEFVVRAGDEKAGRAILFTGAAADYSESGFPAADAIDGKPNTGWAILPQFGRPHAAVFVAAIPFGGGKDTLFTFVLEQLHSATYNYGLSKELTIGRMRLSVTADQEPFRQMGFPDNIRDFLKVPPDKRTPEQEREISKHYRSIAPELHAEREKLARLEAETTLFPPRVDQGASTLIGVEVRRREGFSGEVKLTLEGYGTGRNPTTNEPTSISKNFQVQTLILKEGQSCGTLGLKTKSGAELGTRTILVRGEAKGEGGTAVEYSVPVPLTVAAPLRPPVAKPPKKGKDEMPKEFVQGLEYWYYEGEWDELPDFDLISPVRSGALEDFDIKVPGRETNYAFVFMGYVDIAKEGKYTFYTESNDGSRLFIGETEVVNNDGTHPPIEKNGSIRLKEGKHPLTVTYFQKGGGISLKVSFDGPGFTRTPLVGSSLLRGKKP